jgi:hypothetical protein
MRALPVRGMNRATGRRLFTIATALRKQLAAMSADVPGVARSGAHREPAMAGCPPLHGRTPTCISAVPSDTTGSAGTSVPAPKVTSRPPRVTGHTAARPPGRDDAPSRLPVISTSDDGAARRTRHVDARFSQHSRQAHERRQNR